MNFEKQLRESAQECAQELAASSHKLVFAESCTSGLLASAIAGIPGISAHFCGSFVTYRESLKVDALGVREATLKQHSAVSAQVTLEMLSGALSRCGEATVGLSITGHLGPDAPADVDGTVYVACGSKVVTQWKHSLRLQARLDRQMEAAIFAFKQLNLWLAVQR